MARGCSRYAKMQPNLNSFHHITFYCANSENLSSLGRRALLWRSPKEFSLNAPDLSNGWSSWRKSYFWGANLLEAGRVTPTSEDERY